MRFYPGLSVGHKYAWNVPSNQDKEESQVINEREAMQGPNGEEEEEGVIPNSYHDEEPNSDSGCSSEDSFGSGSGSGSDAVEQEESDDDEFLARQESYEC